MGLGVGVGFRVEVWASKLFVYKDQKAVESLLIRAFTINSSVPPTGPTVFQPRDSRLNPCNEVLLRWCPFQVAPRHLPYSRCFWVQNVGIVRRFCIRENIQPLPFEFFGVPYKPKRLAWRCCAVEKNREKCNTNVP